MDCAFRDLVLRHKIVQGLGISLKLKLLLFFHNKVVRASISKK